MFLMFYFGKPSLVRQQLWNYYYYLLSCHSGVFPPNIILLRHSYFVVAFLVVEFSGQVMHAEPFWSAVVLQRRCRDAGRHSRGWRFDLSSNSPPTRTTSKSSSIPVDNPLWACAPGSNGQYILASTSKTSSSLLTPIAS